MADKNVEKEQNSGINEKLLIAVVPTTMLTMKEQNLLIPAKASMNDKQHMLLTQMQSRSRSPVMLNLAEHNEGKTSIDSTTIENKRQN